MWDTVLEMAVGDGIWAVLFCSLFLYELRDSRRREHRYQETVTKLTSSLELMRDIEQTSTEIRTDCREIRNDCHETLDRCEEIKTSCEAIKTSCEEIKNSCVAITKTPQLP